MRPLHYTESKAISQSDLKVISDGSIAHWLHKQANPEPASKAQIFGQLVHTLVLQPHLLDEDFVVLPKLDRRFKEDKKRYEDILAAAVSKTVVTIEEFQRAEALVDAINKHPTAKQYLNPHGLVFRETPIFATLNGVECKGIPDLFTPDSGGLLIDLKTTASARLDKFQWSARDFRYDVQMAFYADMLAAKGFLVSKYIIIAVESEAPFGISIFEIDPVSIHEGRLQYRLDLEVVKSYLAADKEDVWTGYPLTPQALNIPKRK